MAKKKKKKAAPKPSEASIDAKKIQSENPSPEKKTPPKISSEKKQPKTVSIATCVAGMFLCLALGVYLGTLVPLVSDQPPVAAIPPEIPMESPRTDNAEKASPPKMNAEQNRKRAALLESIARSPDNAQLWTELGNLYFDSRAFEDAINAYEKSLSINPHDPDVLTDLGIMYRETDQFQKAIENFRKASSLDPTHQNSLYNEGVVFAADLHNVEEAAKAWEKLLKINPQARGPEGALVADKIQQLRR